MSADRPEVQWKRPRGLRVIHVVASLLAVLAVSAVALGFNRITGLWGRSPPQPVVIATIDLRLGNTILAAQEGEAQARADLAAGLLQWQTFEPERASRRAEAQNLKRRLGVTLVRKSGEPTPVSRAFMDGYNAVVRAELERRHGREVSDRLLPDPG